MRVLTTPEDIAEGIAHLTRIEPRFGAVVEVHGLPSLRRAPEGLEGLLRIVTDQLLSLKAAESIWKRVEQNLAPFDAVKLSRKREASLMKLGLSGAKARCFIACAKNNVDFARLSTLADDEVWQYLTALPGIGPWTADIYLLANLGRADAWPAGDLALQAAAHHLLGLENRPDSKQLKALAEPWRPWRAVAARLLWSYYRGLKGLQQA
jgi:DNA-3-methyladenine glycosylase II